MILLSSPACQQHLMCGQWNSSGFVGSLFLHLFCETDACLRVWTGLNCLRLCSDEVFPLLTLALKEHSADIPQRKMKTADLKHFSTNYFNTRRIFKTLSGFPDRRSTWNWRSGKGVRVTNAPPRSGTVPQTIQNWCRTGRDIKSQFVLIYY